MTVYLVGAGPGDPDLLTMRAARLLERADVVIHDRLVGSGVLDLIPPGTLLVDVGKRPGDPRRAQADLNALLLHYAALYEVVVRLKGGDPYVFGRGGEEALALLNAGHHVEVVPGLSSALAAPAAAGIPLTHRGRSHGFTVVTAASAHDVASVDWFGIARLDHTLVVLMGGALGASHRHGIDRKRPVAGGAGRGDRLSHNRMSTGGAHHPCPARTGPGSGPGNHRDRRCRGL